MADSAGVDKNPPNAFGKGEFHVQHESDAEWKPGLRGFFDYRDLGMAAKTGGKFQAHVHRPNAPCTGPGDLHYHKVDFQMVYVLKGWARMMLEGRGEITLREGSCMYQELEIPHRLLEHSDDYTAIEILVPAESETVQIAP